MWKKVLKVFYYIGKYVFIFFVSFTFGLGLRVIIDYAFPEPEVIEEEFVCTDTSCENSRVPGGAVPIPNVYLKDYSDVRRNRI
jgi:hypothetical protein